MDRLLKLGWNNRDNIRMSFKGYLVELLKLVQAAVPVVEHLEEVHEVHCYVLHVLLRELVHVVRVGLFWHILTLGIPGASKYNLLVVQLTSQYVKDNLSDTGTESCGLITVVLLGMLQECGRGVES